MDRVEISLSGRSNGTIHQLTAFRFGRPGSGPSVYVQGGLHADEGPGMLAAWSLCEKLKAVEADGNLYGSVTVVPQANPVGLSQFSLGQQEGRFDIYDGRNFNRHYPDLVEATAQRLAGKLTGDSVANVRLIRLELAHELSARPAVTPADHLRKALMGLAIDADFVLDLHCDGEADVHLYTQPEFVGALEPLARLLGARAVLVAQASGDHPFDEALARPWRDLATLFPDAGIPAACVSATVELRGRKDVSRQMAASDAEALIAFLTQLGTIAGPNIALPPALCQPTPLAGSEVLVATVSGLLSFVTALGAKVESGDTIAEIIDPVSGSITPVKATTTGVFYARADTRIAETGKRIGKIAGAVAFRNGLLLSP